MLWRSQQLVELPEARSVVLRMLQEIGKASKLKVRVSHMHARQCVCVCARQCVGIDACMCMHAYM